MGVPCDVATGEQSRRGKADGPHGDVDEWRDVLGCGHVGTGEESSREYDVIGPVLMVEVLSPTNKTEAWTNVRAYTTIPTVKKILIRIRAELLRRDDQNQWPERPLVNEDGAPELASIGFSVPLRSVYRGTRLTRDAR